MSAPNLEGAVFLIDGNSLAYRAFYALPESIATSDGFPTNALYGFSTMLIKILTDYRPAAVVVAWDAGKRVFRHEEYEEYKAGRKPMPDPLVQQMEHFDELVEAFGCRTLKKEGYEADDILATLVREARAEGRKAVVVTADRDALQLVGDGVFVMANTRGISDVKIYDSEAVEKKYGVPPAKVPDFIGLKGDSSDNIPGVPGIGDKTAAALLADHASLEELLEHRDELKGKPRKLLEEYGEQALFSKELATMYDEVPLQIDADTLGGVVPDPGRLRRLLERFEFDSLVRRLEEMEVLEQPPALSLALAEVDPATLVERLAAAETAALGAAETGSGLHLALYDGGDAVLVAPVSREEAARLSLPESSGVAIASHDGKALVSLLPGLPVESGHDTMIAAYLLKPQARSYELSRLASAAGIRVEVEAAASEAAATAQAAAQVYRLAPKQQERLKADGLSRLFHEVEMPLVRVLADMERAGVMIDLPRLGELASKVSDRLDQLADEIRELAGEEFNIDSPQQLSKVLFERLGLPPVKKTKTGYSTDASVLASLRDRHPIVPLVENYRELAKLNNTYIRALPQLADPETWRVHTTFNQTVTATGRLSSSDPNLQNIPVRTPLGEEIRDCFVAADGCLLVAADYSQVELRILAHLADEPRLKEVFTAGGDIHRATAAEVFGVSPEAVTDAERGRAKAVNFGIIYGISPYGLAEQLGISRQEAAGYIEGYLARYPRVAAFRREVVERAAADGYVTTILGRRRPVPELRSADDNVRRLGERLAINTVIQGSAADIIKVAMIDIHRQVSSSGLEAKLVLQVHDELVLETPEPEVEEVKQLVKERMEGAHSLDPPLEAEVRAGETWLQAK